MRRHPRVAPLVVCVLSLSSIARGNPPAHLWSKGLGGFNPDAAWAVATDGSDNVIFSGLFGQYVDFGGGPLSSTGLDMFLVKYDASGAYQWGKVFSPQSSDVFADALGNVAITGNSSGPLDFGGGNLSPDYAVSAYIAKFDASGAHLWSRRFGAVGSEAYGQAVAIDGDGSVVIIGYYQGTIDFGGGPLASSGRDIFVAKYDVGGAHVWSKRLGSTGTDIGNDIDVDASNNVVITGGFQGTVNFGGGNLVATGFDMFLVKYDPSGAHVWSKRFGATSGVRDEVIDLDGSGNAVVGGRFQGTANFGGTPLTSVGQEDIFVAKYNVSGTHQWSKRFGNSNADYIKGVGVDVSGNVSITGAFEGSINFGGGPLTNLGFQNAYVARFNSAGIHDWSQSLSGADNVSSEGLAVDASSNILITGFFSGTASFGGPPFTSTAWDDIFLTKFGQEPPVPVFISRFVAFNRGSTVVVEWAIANDEALDTFTLYRREGSSSAVVTIGDPLTTNSFTDYSVESGKTYAYEIVIRAASGELFRSATERVTVRSAATSLGPNYPNPFNPKTTIEYTVGEPMPVTIEVFDVSGAVVARLDHGMRTSGVHHAEWDGRDTNGNALGSGIYFYRMSGLERVGARKMILLK